MVNSKSNVKEASEKFLEVLQRNTEERTGAQIGVIFIRRSKTLDQLSVSGLIVTGAVLTLSVSNARDVLAIMAYSGYAWMMTLFLLSALSGFCAKWAFALADLLLSIHCEMIAEMQRMTTEWEAESDDVHKSALERGISLDTYFPRSEKVKEAFLGTFPEKWRTGLIRHINKEQSGDGLSGLLINAWKYIGLQAVAFGIQILLLLLGFVVAVAGFSS